MKIILLPLEAYLNINKKRIYFAFIKDLKINPLTLFYQWFDLPWYFGQALDWIRGISLPTLFDQFDKGLITPAQFRAELRNKFSALVNKTDAEIDQAWNKMYLVEKKGCQAFKEVKEIHNNETIFVTFYGDMNMLHAQSIKEQHTALSGQINLTPGKLFLSYLEQVKGLELIVKYTQTSVPIPLSEQEPFKKKSKPHILIAESPRSFPAKLLVIYTPPPEMPYPKLGLLSWVFAPRASWDAYNKQEHYNELVKLSLQNNFALIPSQATTTDPNIIQSVKNSVDIRAKPTQNTSLNLNNLPPSQSYTPRHLSPGNNTERTSPPRSPTTLTGTSKFKNFRISS